MMGKSVQPLTAVSFFFDFLSYNPYSHTSLYKTDMVLIHTDTLLPSSHKHTNTRVETIFPVVQCIIHWIFTYSVPQLEIDHIYHRD